MSINKNKGSGKLLLTIVAIVAILTAVVTIYLNQPKFGRSVRGERILIDPVFEDASPVSFFNKPFEGTDIYQADDMPDIAQQFPDIDVALVENGQYTDDWGGGLPARFYRQQR